MDIHINPTASEDVLPVNDGLEIRYSRFLNDTTYVRPQGSWRLWTPQVFVPPAANRTIGDMHDAGVEWDLYEHVSVAIAGEADYVFTGPEGEISQTWQAGCHNVENGGGYLPRQTFTRHFRNDFELCCVIRRFGRSSGTNYRFEVITEPTSLTEAAFFVHYAAGPRQRQTDFNVMPGYAVDLAAGDIAIICTTR
jgi:hypothetical protein